MTIQIDFASFVAKKRKQAMDPTKAKQFGTQFSHKLRRICRLDTVSIAGWRSGTGSRVPSRLPGRDGIEFSVPCSSRPTGQDGTNKNFREFFITLWRF